MKWPQVEIATPTGLQSAIAPEIISASRSTDIPAFYAEWFMNRLRQGYVKWLNPFNHRHRYVSFENVRAIVFWSKNPSPLRSFLGEIDRRCIAYYVHFTVNDYEAEGLEPGVPPLGQRIEAFKQLSQQIGKDRVIWRFDPLIASAGLDVGRLVDKVRRVGDEIAAYTTKLVFSFADISVYRKVQNKLKRAGITYREFDEPMMIEAAHGIASLCKGWEIAAATCAEPVDLTQFGVKRNKCVDDNLIGKLTNNDPRVRRLLGMDSTTNENLFGLPERAKTAIKDPGQRAECGCAFSKDIGQYNTCPHQCVYCYANTSDATVAKNVKASSKTADSILPH